MADVFVRIRELVVEAVHPYRKCPLFLSGGVDSSTLLAALLALGEEPVCYLKKELSLCGIQRPLPVNFFDGMDAREFFRFGDFAGWIIEKPEA